MEAGPGGGGRDLEMIFAVTVATWQSWPVFDDVSFGMECADLLRPALERAGVALHAYCLLADHGCLVIGVPQRERLPPAVTLWKSLCAEAWRRRGGRSLWQRGYAERLRPDARSLREAAVYLLSRPVRAGLVRDPADYPLCGPAPAR